MYKYFKVFIKEYKRKIFIFIILYLIFSFFNILSPIIVKEFINNALIKMSPIFLNKIIILFIVLTCFIVVTGLISNYIAITILQEIKNSVKYNLYNIINNAKYKFLNESNGAEITYRIMNDTSSIEKLLNLFFIGLPIEILTIVFLGGITIKWNYKLGTIILLIFIIQILIINSLKKRLKTYIIKQQKESQILTGLIAENINNSIFIKGLNMTKKTSENINDKLQNLKKINIKSSKLLIISSIVSILINNIWTLVVISYGGTLVLNNKMSIGELVAFLMSASMIYPKFKSLIDNIINFQTIKVSFGRVIEYYEIEQCTIVNDKINESFRNKNIYIKNLEFYYNKNQYIFKNFNAEIKANAINVIIGENGSGKSTLVKIIANLIDVNDNSIFIGSVDLNKINTTVIRENIMYQPQNIFLLNGTILENIICNKEYDELLVYKALESVKLLDFIKKLPLGLQTNLSNNNILLSQGQCQKLSLARIYYNKPSIIILDEPTAFSDAEGIQIFNKMLLELKVDSTVIVIAHNEATIKKADYIIEVGKFD